MKLKLLLATVFVAGIGASYALADNGHGQGQGEGKTHCQQVHVNGTIAPQTFTVTLTRDAKRLNLAAGSQVTVQAGATGQTLRFNAEACSSTQGSATQLVLKSAEIHARNAQETTTEAQTTTGP